MKTKILFAIAALIALPPPTQAQHTAPELAATDHKIYLPIAINSGTVQPCGFRMWVSIPLDQCAHVN